MCACSFCKYVQVSVHCLLTYKDCILLLADYVMCEKCGFSQLGDGNTFLNCGLNLNIVCLLKVVLGFI